MLSMKKIVAAPLAIGSAVILPFKAYATPTAMDGFDEIMGSVDLSTASDTVVTIVTALVGITLIAFAYRLIRRFVR